MSVKQAIPNKGFNLVDGYAMNAEHPDRFHLPDPTAVEALKSGDSVKMIFEPHDAEVIPERMWVTVLIPPTDEHSGVGELDNEPVDDLFPIGYLGRVVFERRHIIDIYDRPTKGVQ